MREELRVDVFKCLLIHCPTGTLLQWEDIKTLALAHAWKWLQARANVANWAHVFESSVEDLQLFFTEVSLPHETFEAFGSVTHRRQFSLITYAICTSRETHNTPLRHKRCIAWLTGMRRATYFDWWTGWSQNDSRAAVWGSAAWWSFWWLDLVGYLERKSWMGNSRHSTTYFEKMMLSSQFTNQCPVLSQCEIWASWTQSSYSYAWMATSRLVWIDPCAV